MLKLFYELAQYDRDCRSNLLSDSSLMLGQPVPAAPGAWQVVSRMLILESWP